MIPANLIFVKILQLGVDALLDTANKASGKVTFTRAAATNDPVTIPSGTLVATAGGVQFTTTEDGVIVANDVSIALVDIQAVLAGVTGNQKAATITTIVNPIAGMAVTNPLTTGTDGKRQWDLHLLGYTQDEKDRWYARFLSSKPTIVQAYPRGTFKFPVWAVILSAERDNQRAIGDRILYDTGPSRQSVIGNLQDVVIGCHIYCDGIDEVNIHHSICKRLILGYKRYIIENFEIDNINFSSASDVEPNLDMLPEELFVRVLEWVVSSLEAVYYDLGEPPNAKTVFTFMEDITLQNGVEGGVKPTGS